MTQSASLWQLDDNNGLLDCGPLKGVAISGPPSIGFLLDEWRGQAFHHAAVLSFGGPTDQPQSLSVIEAYIRGSDLVFIYEKTPPHNIAPQTYWRASFNRARQAVRVELIISLQTDLLDSAPLFPISSNVGESELLHASDLSPHNFQIVQPDTQIKPLLRRDSSIQLFAFRVNSVGLTYAQMVHPSDFVWAQAVGFQDGNFSVTSALFPERLEKGVIRRARICGWFLPAENDLAVAVELASQFVDEPLPLTT